MYRIPIREQSWLQVAKMLYHRMSTSDQETLIEQIPGLRELNKQSQITEAILKLVEIEAFRLERIDKNLPDISEDEIGKLCRGPIFYASLVSSLIDTEEPSFAVDKSSVFQYIYKKIQEEIRVKKEKPIGVRVSEKMFGKLLKEMNQLKLNSAFGNIHESIEDTLTTGDYEGFVVLIMGCSVTCDVDIDDQKISFVY